MLLPDKQWNDLFFDNMNICTIRISTDLNNCYRSNTECLLVQSLYKKKLVNKEKIKTY